MFKVTDFSTISNKKIERETAEFFHADEKWVLPLDHLSASSLSMLQACPRQWQQRYILGKIETPGAAVVLGTANHKAHGFNWNCKVVSGNDLPTNVIVDYYHDDAWPKTLEERGGAGEVKWDADPEDARMVGERMVVAYHEAVSPRLEPVAVEKQITVRIPDVPVPLDGYIDLVQADGRPMVDLKTAKQKESKIKPEWKLQGLVYQLAEQKPIDWHVVTKQKTTAIYTPLEEPGLSQPVNAFQLAAGVKLIQDLARLANYYYVTYGPDESWPQLGVAHKWRCDWCGYRKDCPIWRIA